MPNNRRPGSPTPCGELRKLVSYRHAPTRPLYYAAKIYLLDKAENLHLISLGVYI